MAVLFASRQGKMQLHQARTSDEAVELATKFQQSGRYDWFRGQSQNWPVVPSLARRTGDERERAIKRLNRFLAWSQSTPGMRDFKGKLDQVVAVAQHYGIATLFVDFTTDPKIAGIFAAEAPQEATLPEASIICLNTQDFLDFPWDGLLEGNPDSKVQCLTLDVPNLWRLEAQAGVFVECPFEQLERIYDFDRIVFPAPTAPLSQRMHNKIYPPRKSSLEQLIDQYFNDERVYLGTLEVDRFLAEIGVTPNRWDPKPLAVAPSGTWNVNADTWHPPVRENYAAVGTALGLELEIPDKKTEIERSVRQQLETALDGVNAAQSKLLRFKPELPDAYKTEQRDTLAGILNRLWDGLRLYPYERDELVEAVVAATAMYLSSTAADRDDPRTWDCFKENCIEVEYAFLDGGYSRSYVLTSRLQGAFRSDLRQVLPPDHAASAADSKAMLFRLYEPGLLFDRDRFAALYSTQIVPCQLVWRPSDAVSFSPYGLKTFGLP